jgi:MoaA/NifB/PqqE/SkfB family radical SAM enzyme
LTLEDAADLSRQADDLGLARFVITGGEPLVFTDLFPLIREINPQKHYINMDTNGWYLTVDMAASLKEAGVDRIQLSIDSMDPKAHDLFRGKPGAHLHATRAADAAVAAGLDLFIQTVVTRSRLYSAEFKAFLEHWNLKGVGVFVTYIKPTGAGEALRDEMVGWEDMEYMRELERTYDEFTHLTPAYGRAGGCISVRGMVSVTPYGDVLPCPYHYTPIGNLFDDSLERILERGMSTPPFNNRIQTCWIADKDYKHE